MDIRLEDGRLCTFEIKLPSLPVQRSDNRRCGSMHGEIGHT